MPGSLRRCRLGPGEAVTGACHKLRSEQSSVSGTRGQKLEYFSK